jgi:hypothetical protein
LWSLAGLGPLPSSELADHFVHLGARHDGISSGRSDRSTRSGSNRAAASLFRNRRVVDESQADDRESGWPTDKLGG